MYQNKKINLLGLYIFMIEKDGGNYVYNYDINGNFWSTSLCYGKSKGKREKAKGTYMIHMLKKIDRYEEKKWRVDT